MKTLEYLMDLIKLNDYEWEMPRTGRMRVPARVYASEQLLNVIKGDRTLEQLSNMASLPGIIKQAIALPDAHQGYGFCIGGVAGLSTKEGGISPGGVGFDINCGVRVLKSNLKEADVKPGLNELINTIFANVPAGLASKGAMNLSRDELKSVLEEGVDYLLRKGLATKQDLLNCEEKGRMREAKASAISDRALGRGLPQLGSLGSGNHFLDIHVVDEVLDEKLCKTNNLFKGQVTFMIHCGSRGLGHQVASDYLRKIETTHADMLKELPDRELAYAPAGSELAVDYFSAMSAAANYAWANRQLIMHNVRESIKKFFNNSTESLGLDLFYDVCHNICKVEKHEGVECYLHRKGATRSFPGDKVIIPGSMGTNSYLLVGGEESMSKSFGSTAHGAGRVMSRTKAKKLFTPDQVVKKMENKRILLRSASRMGMVEETSEVYKDVDEVVKVSTALGICRPIARLRPIAVING